MQNIVSIIGNMRGNIENLYYDQCSKCKSNICFSCGTTDISIYYSSLPKCKKCNIECCEKCYNKDDGFCFLCSYKKDICAKFIQRILKENVGTPFIFALVLEENRCTPYDSILGINIDSLYFNPDEHRDLEPAKPSYIPWFEIRDPKAIVGYNTDNKLVIMLESYRDDWSSPKIIKSQEISENELANLIALFKFSHSYVDFDLIDKNNNPISLF